MGGIVVGQFKTKSIILFWLTEYKISCNSGKSETQEDHTEKQ